jgi:hypothetical protein
LAEGKATGFAFFALAVAVIAGNEGGLGMWFGVGLGNLLWVAASIVMSMGTLWFGIALMRSRANAI